MSIIWNVLVVLYFLTLGWNSYKDRQVSTCIIDNCNMNYTQKWCRDTFDYDSFTSLTWKFSNEFKKDLFHNLINNCIQEKNSSCYQTCKHL
jgi:hypothetical protein